MKFKPLPPVLSFRKYIMLNVMRLAILLFFGTTFGFAPLDGLSQEKIHFKTSETLTLDAIFERIESETDYHFIYRSDLFKDAPKINVDKGKIKVDKLLEKSLRAMPFDFTISGNSIVLVPRLISSHSDIQQQEITGTVTDEDGVPLPGVNITVEGTTRGTQTDFDGNYTIEAEKGEVLHFSFVGFAEQDVTVRGDVLIDVQMEESQNALDEVVVVGYGTQKASEISSAISSIKSENFKKGIVTRAIEQIQGKVPGVVITTPSGDPNDSESIRIRGQASLTGGQDPLIVLDGVALDDPKILEFIPSGDIESYSVLKDQSATAVYGSRGANGVILVETKKGGGGENKTTINYSSQIGVSNIAKNYNMLDRDQWRETSLQLGVSSESLDQLDDGGNTNWPESVTQTGYTHNHYLSISGGADNFSYHSSVNYMEQEGIIIDTKREQLGLNFYANHKAFNDKLDIKLGIRNSSMNKNLAEPEMWTPLFYNLPVQPIYNEDGSFFEFYDNRIFNPVQYQRENINRSKESYTLLFGGMDLNLGNLIDGLSVGVLGSISKNNRKPFKFIPVHKEEGGNNIAEREDNNTNSVKGDIHINYSKDFGKHHLDFNGVHEYSTFVNDWFKAHGENFLMEGTSANALGTGDPKYSSVDSHKERHSLSSFLARLSYNYDRRYYISASFRRDGSSKFGRNNRWGNFPAFSIAWRPDRESFMEDVSWINDLKIRAGYGVTGNQDAIDSYRTQRLYGGVGRFYDGLTDSYPLAYAPIQNENPDLKWEEVHGVNIGMDFTLFENKLTGDINWYHNTTKNLLFDYRVPVPPFFVNNILANVGTMVNKGLELQLSTDVIDRNKFKWFVNGQITFINTRITNLSGSYSGFEISTNNVQAGGLQGSGLTNHFVTFLKKGYTPYVFYLPKSLGINSDGKQLFSDGKGGEVIESELKEDMYYYIDPSPDFTYGLGSTWQYKNWAFDLFVRGVYGQRIYNNSLMNIANLNRLPGQNVTNSAVKTGYDDTPVESDMWLENASFLRLDNLRLAYTFSKLDWVKNLTISVTGNNLFILTSYKGLDPEVGVSGNDAYLDVTYKDDGYYPKSKSISFGVNATF